VHIPTRPYNYALLLRREGKHLTVDVRDYGGTMRLAIWGRTSWRKWDLTKHVEGQQLWLIKYIVRLLAALEETNSGIWLEPWLASLEY